MGVDVYVQPVDATLAELAAEHYPTAPVREDTRDWRAVFVIGAGAGDRHGHQLWIDENRLLFVCSIQPNPRDTTKTDEY